MKKIYNTSPATPISRILFLFFVGIALSLPERSLAQAVLQSESFESTIFPAPGWRQIKTASNITAAFSRQVVATATNPAIGAAPSGGAAVMMLNSFSSGSTAFPDTALMVTKPFDFSNNAGVNPEFKFYVYRDGGYTTNDDHLNVYVNTSPSKVGATLLTNTSGTTKIPRRIGSFPSVGAAGWYQFTYNLPAATYNQNRYYFIIEGVAQAGNNMFVDLVNTTTYPSATNAADVSFEMFLQNGASAGLGTTNNFIVGVRCIVGGTSGCGVVNGASSTAVKLDSLLLNTNGTTNVNDIQNAKIFYTGGSNLFNTTYVSPFPATAGTDDYPSQTYGQVIAVPSTNLDFVNGISSCFYLEYDTTYFWLTYDVKPTATGGNFLDADFRYAVVGGSPANCPSLPGTGSVTVTPPAGGFSISGSVQIDLPYCTPTYTVGTAWAGYSNNDYVQSVSLNGVAPTAINTNFQGGMPYPSNNNTGLPASLGCYGLCDFTAHPPDYELWQTVALRTVTLQQSATYSITVQAGTWFSSNYITAWIDYNRDGDFVDAGEQLFAPVSLAANGFSTNSFTVPAAGYTGVTRLRVREVYANSVINPCQQYTYGECEDFNITIIPNCPIGYKLWLGNNNNWHDPANWCGGVPTITDNAVIDKAQVPGASSRTYFKPTVKSNASQANCNNLTISALDTLVIDAPAPAATALKVRGILTNNGRMEVVSAFAKNVVYSTGVLQINNYTPFKGTATDARTQIIYTAAELALEGLVAGDRINAIEYTLWNKGSTVPFNNFNVSYALIPFTQHASNVPYAGPFTTVFNAATYSTNPVNTVNTITLSTPIIWDGVSNLMIQYCYDNGGAIGTTDDRIYITQTTGRKSTLILSNINTSPNVAPGCSMVPGAGVTDNFFTGLFDRRPNFTFKVDRIYGKPIITAQNNWLNNGTFSPGNSLVVMDSTVSPQLIAGSQPTTFHEFKLNKGAVAQNVTMQQDVSINDTLDLFQGCLLLNGKVLNILNSAASTGTHTNFAAIGGPITRSNGFIISETPALMPSTQTTTAGGFVKWTVGTTTGWRVIPFGSNATTPVAIPFTFQHNSGDMGVFSVGTYNTPAANTPFPPTVTHLNIFSSATNNSANVVDRFWVTEKTGANPVANLTFRWPDIENSSGMSALNPPRAQPWRYISTVSPAYEAWLRITNTSPTAPVGSTLGTTLSYPQTTAIIAGVADSTRVPNWDWPLIPGGPLPNTPIGNYIPWALSNNNQPLPVELVDFNAEARGSKVRLSWITASEINNDYFTVERSDADMQDFDFITKVNSYMHNSNMMLSYEAWDHNPLPGLQYYRLKQTDLDGQYSYSDLRAVYFGRSKSFEITNVYGATGSGSQFQVEFEYDSELPLNTVITDAAGKVVFKRNNIQAAPGANKLTLDQNLPRGMYFILLQNQEKTVNRKFFY